jgi:hypothetical protein
MLHRGNGTLSLGRPDPPQDRLEADAMLIHCPQLDLRVGEGSRDLAYERAELFLKRAWAAASAWT